MVRVLETLTKKGNIMAMMKEYGGMEKYKSKKAMKAHEKKESKKMEAKEKVMAKKKKKK
jgi:hypothetical protein